jgi:hypothetical protein
LEAEVQLYQERSAHAEGGCIGSIRRSRSGSSDSHIMQRPAEFQPNCGNSLAFGKRSYRKCARIVSAT